MATGYATEAIGVLDGTVLPASKSDGRIVNAKTRVFQATLDMAASTTKRANGDINYLFRIPRGYKPVLGWTLGSVTMGANATIAIGIVGAAGKYRAAATHTGTTPSLFMLSAAADDAPLTDYEDWILTVGHADGLPAEGILQVFALCAAR